MLLPGWTAGFLWSIEIQGRERKPKGRICKQRMQTCHCLKLAAKFRFGLFTRGIRGRGDLPTPFLRCGSLWRADLAHPARIWSESEVLDGDSFDAAFAGEL